jgi:putative spermidine/putrescine transport system ATP-binding protein
MSEGRVEQIGPPPEIYNFPATPFVASFVGTLNLLPARVVADGGKVSVADHEITPSKPLHDRAGTAVTVALRPEAIELGEAGGANRLRGHVEDVMFLGSIVRTRLNIGDGAVLSFDQFNDPALAPPAIGEAATVSFPVEATLVLEGRASAEDVVEAAIAES